MSLTSDTQTVSPEIVAETNETLVGCENSRNGSRRRIDSGQRARTGTTHPRNISRSAEISIQVGRHAVRRNNRKRRRINLNHDAVAADQHMPVGCNVQSPWPCQRVDLPRLRVDANEAIRAPHPDRPRASSDVGALGDRQLDWIAGRGTSTRIKSLQAGAIVTKDPDSVLEERDPELVGVAVELDFVGLTAGLQAHVVTGAGACPDRILRGVDPLAGRRGGNVGWLFRLDTSGRRRQPYGAARATRTQTEPRAITAKPGFPTSVSVRIAPSSDIVGTPSDVTGDGTTEVDGSAPSPGAEEQALAAATASKSARIGPLLDSTR